MENRIKEIQDFENTQKESLSKLSKGTIAPIYELEPLIFNFISSQFQKYTEFKYLNNAEELINRKKEFFPVIFTTGSPKQLHSMNLEWIEHLKRIMKINYGKKT